MEPLQVRQLEFLSPDYDQSITLRTKVLRIPLGLEFSCEQLEQEYDQMHFACFESSGKMIGCMILKPDEPGVFQMRQVAIELEHQGRGAGRLLVEFAEKWAAEMGSNKIILHARDQAMPFYKKLGYQLDGPGFEEIGILHYLMFKKISNQ